MALSDFFRINLPYGIQRKEKNEWTAFNREYLPLGTNEKTPLGSGKAEYIYTVYKPIREGTLLKIADQDENRIRRNDKGEIVMIFLYHDGSNPASNPEGWTKYMNKLRLLSKFHVLTECEVM